MARKKVDRSEKNGTGHLRWTAFVPTPKDLLIDRVQRGLLSPEKAEALAVRKSLGPLAAKPPDEAFDPMAETSWTLPMAIAWIAWRSPGKVRAHWDAYRRQCWHWMPVRWRPKPNGHLVSGFDLKQLQPSGQLFLELELAADRGNALCTFIEARTALWSRLADGSIVASGIDTGGATNSRIASDEWTRLEWQEAKSEEPVCARATVSTGGYDRIRLDARVLRGVWPAPNFGMSSLPALIEPAGDGYMPLSMAALWIATLGGHVEFEPADVSAWKKGYDELLYRVVSGDVPVSGLSNGSRVNIDRLMFVDLQVEYPVAKVTFEAPEGFRLSTAPISEATGIRLADELTSMSGVIWSDLMVAKTAIARHWSFGLGDTETRRPGRPSTMHLLEQELRRRHSAGVMKTTLASECRALREWFSRAYPDDSPTSRGAIENALREVYWQLGTSHEKR